MALFWVLSIHLLPLFSQSVIDSLLFWHEKELNSYEFAANDSTLIMSVQYASAKIENPEVWDKLLPEHVPYQIDLVFTQYPKRKEDWRTNYDNLLHTRIKNIRALHPLFRSDAIIWNFIHQTACESEEAAKKMFHGFVIHTHLVPHWEPEPYTIVEANRPQIPVKHFGHVNSPNDIEAVLRGETVLLDSGIYHIFSRNPEWENMLIVMDWTGSMYVYGAQVLLWHQLNMQTHPWAVKHFVFFNDGNNKTYKPIGNSGGIYYTRPNNIDSILQVMKICAHNGGGGDDPENDVEALYKGMTLSDYDEVILIADNSPVKDISFLNKLNRPVRVVICNPMSGTQPVHEHYIQIAKATGGSLHTIYEDIDYMKERVER